MAFHTRRKFPRRPAAEFLFPDLQLQDDVRPGEHHEAAGSHPPTQIVDNPGLRAGLLPSFPDISEATVGDSSPCRDSTWLITPAVNHHSGWSAIATPRYQRVHVWPGMHNATADDHISNVLPANPAQLLSTLCISDAPSQGMGSDRDGLDVDPIYGSPLTDTHKDFPSTRFLYLHPGQAGDPIRCSLKTGLVDGKTVYKALSYHWAGQDADDPIFIGASAIFIGETLKAFLSAVRHEQDDCILWIDALCINQANDQEKAYQVAAMSNIYRSAESVIVWLGEASPDSRLAFDLLERLADLWPKRQPAPEPTSYPDLSSSIARMKPPSNVEWAALGNLWARPYWTRVWVVQELSLASMSSVFMCGPDVLSLPTVAMAEAAIYQCRTDLPRSAIHDAVLYVPDLLWLSREARAKCFRMDLQEILELTVLFSASEPRDRIFALLGIADAESDARTLEPRYSRGYSLALACVDVCRFLLESCQSLDFLCRHRLTFPEHQTSWIPDYSCIGNGPPGPYTHASTYNADGGLEARASISEDGRTLQADGFIVDTVRTVQGPFVSISSADLYDVLVSIETAISTRLDSGSFPGPMPNSPCPTGTKQERVTELMSKAFGFQGTDREEWRQEYLQYMKSHCSWRKPRSKRPSIFIQRTTTSLKNCCFFSTEKGQFGIGAAGTRAGDLTCILYGSSMCQVLRRGEFYMHVGPAIVAGIMDGELGQRGRTFVIT
ncbi:hypothetical protein FGG08_000159 [Neofusicoccum parvum]|uniref:Uncharacterized protein n=1 Tax=Neofusicoccum parvum TaxID=310453 RepID=A0ACB5S147_9PEZI|nr:hypothetical protein FGG08_000159 [Neofusicoccum parvum]